MDRSLTTGLCALALFATQASAQRYNLRKPAEILDEVSIGMQFVSPCDISISGLGNIGSYVQGSYADATIAKDSTAGTSNDDGKTYYFSFNSLMQLTNSSGSPDYTAPYLKATSVRAEAVNGTFGFTDDSGMSAGLDIEYTHYFSRRHKLGMVFAVNTSGFSIDKSASWDINMITSSDLYAAYGLEGVNNFTGIYDRPRVFSSDMPEVFISYTPYNSSPITGTIDGTATATGNWDLKASYINFRFGPTYNMMLTRRVIMRLSGGLSIVSASSRFRWDESFTAPLESGNYDATTAGSVFKSKILFGGWADVGAHYRVNRNMTVYSAIQYQATTDSLELTSKYGHHIELDSSSIYSIRTGFTWAF